MIFYITVDDAGHRHIEATQNDIRAINKDFSQVDVPVDKAGLLSFLKTLLTEQNELIDKLQNQPEEIPVKAPEPKPLSYAERSVQIDEIFANLPLPHQLSLAQIALENARYRVPVTETL